MPGERVLLVEDDVRIASFVERGLAAEGYSVTHVGDGEQALSLAGDEHFPLIILDRMIPRLDGLEVCRRLRKSGCDSLVLMLTAKESLQDKIDGLKGGADDYLTKPFAFDELLARLEALLRRTAGKGAAAMLQVLDLTLDPAAKAVRRGSRAIRLTAREFALLAYLMEHAGTVVSRSRLLNAVWGLSFDPGTKVLDVYIRYLRQKVDGIGELPMIQTVRGFGYTIRR